LYSIEVYPTEELESVFLTSKPKIYTATLVVIFFFTTLVFILYDALVERRQKVVMSTAVASNAIVASLFPAVVRKRLYQQDAPPKPKNPVMEAAKSLRASGAMMEERNPKNKPIADLFHDCTVLFADIVGFTSWSSQREPTEVFTVLETLYGSFDRIAKKRGVFKVETIGDCYLAVTGLPDPQKDHAVRMVQFAFESLRKLTTLVQMELNDTYDTSDLSMRLGLHSGPVTAGVLRGEKSRFQLFGDTVNTAARMESNGRSGKIQVV
jgi:class 3 adenylate cyclase